VYLKILVRASVLQKQEIKDRIVWEASRLTGSSAFGGVATDMSALFVAISRLPLSNMDNWERLIRNEYHRALANTKPAKWKFWIQPKRSPNWVDLCSYNGFTRECALRNLSGAAPNRFFFAMAVRRLNDWVPQVRAAASDQLLSIAMASNAEDIVDVLCAIFPHWGSWRRVDNAGKQSLLEVASIEAVINSLKSRLMSATAGALPSILLQAGQAPALDAYLLEIANNAIQPSVRALAYKSLLAGKVAWLIGRKWEWTDIRYCKGYYKPIFCERSLSVKIPLEETVRAAVADRSAIVRRVAGDALIREFETIGSAAHQLAALLALDSHPSVAEKGDFVLKQLSQVRTLG
jgi:hypothetical protein